VGVLLEQNVKYSDSAFAAQAAVEWRHPVHYLALGAKYASGKTSSLSAFLPLTTNTLRFILEPKLSGLTMISIDYVARLNDLYSIGVFPAYFMLNGSDGGGRNRLGAEIYAAFYWSPFPDISLNLGAGAFLPSLGNFSPDEKVSWRAELNVVISFEFGSVPACRGYAGYSVVNSGKVSAKVPDTGFKAEGTQKVPDTGIRRLSLHPSRSVAAGKFFYFVCGDYVIVAFNRVFKTACGNGKFKAFLRRHSMQVRVD